MYYHTKLTYSGRDHFWWNFQKEAIVQEILIPFINGQIVPINLVGHQSLLNMKNVTLLRIYKTEKNLSSQGKGIAPKDFDTPEFETYECTGELINDVKELQSASASTSLIQKAFAVTKNQVFVVMKFGDKYLDSAYEGAIKPVIEEFGNKSLRIDEIQDSGRISDQVLQAIASSKYILSDLTGERPNCYYETGFAHALGKKLILTIRKGDKIHFDVADYRFIQWETEADLRRSLRERFRGLETAASA